MTADPSNTDDRETALAHVAILASAGSGKTFQLTNRYMRLLLDGAEPGSILASTFTRLAAGEIRDRILGRLAAAAEGDAQRAELATHLGRAELSSGEVFELLGRLSRRLHQVQVRTLDSFFAAIVHCFALELGLDPVLRLVEEDEAARLRREAIRLMLDERDPQPLIELLRVLTDGAASRSVTDAIDSIVSGLHELYREAPREAWSALEPVPGLLERADLLRAIDTLVTHEPDVAHRSVRKSHAESSAMLHAQHVLVDHWKAWLEKGIASKLIAGESTYFGKEIPAETFALYEPLLDHARAVIRQSIIQRTSSLHELLERFDRQYEAVKRRARAMTFADLTHAINRPGRPGGSEALWFRLDATLHHLLLDEMQDTSISQWRVLQPIVEEIVSYRPPVRTFFCVGDVKQSIYGWREACPEVLESIPTLLAGPDGSPRVMSQPLDWNWRSSPVVIGVVNEIFGSIDRNALIRQDADLQHAAAEWSRIFHAHETKREDLPGYVELRATTYTENGSNMLRKWDEAATLIAELHRRDPHRSIGVLTRTNKGVHELLYRLGPGRENIPATGRGGGALTDAPAVNAVLDLLRLADHPEHSIAAFNVMHSPLGPKVGLSPLPDGAVPRDGCRAVAGRVRADLLRRGYAATIGRWIRAIAPKVDQREMRRLIQLQQLAVQHDRRATLRPDDFVRHVERVTVADPFAAPVQVMTVHQSKGLEFDLVVLPDLEHALVQLRNLQIVAERSGATGPVTRIARHLWTEAWELFDDTRAMLSRHRTRQAREAFALLYVALTRARHALHLIIAPPKPSEKIIPKSFAGLLRAALGIEQVEPGAVLTTAGDPDWWKLANREPPAASSQPDWATRERPIALTSVREAIPRGRRVSAASALPHERAPLGELLRIPHEEARDRGTAIHAMFEQIGWIEDFAPDEASLLEVARMIAPRRGPAWARSMVEAFSAMCDQSEVRCALSRGSRDADALELHREWPFARLLDEQVQQGIIDRLVLERGPEGTVRRASILDFKTDQVDAAAAEARAGRYRAQLAVYRDTVAEVFAVDPAQISTALLFVDCGRRVEL